MPIYTSWSPCSGPLEEALLYDQPSGWGRIHRAMVWKAEHISDPGIRVSAGALVAKP